MGFALSPTCPEELSPLPWKVLKPRIWSPASPIVWISVIFAQVAQDGRLSSYCDKCLVPFKKTGAKTRSVWSAATEGQLPVASTWGLSYSHHVGEEGPTAGADFHRTHPHAWVCPWCAVSRSSQLARAQLSQPLFQCCRDGSWKSAVMGEVTPQKSASIANQGFCLFFLESQLLNISPSKLLPRTFNTWKRAVYWALWPFWGTGWPCPYNQNRFGQTWGCCLIWIFWKYSFTLNIEDNLSQ